MYYNRTLSNSFSKIIEPGGDLRWLFEFVQERNDLDLLIGRNDSMEWISVYRGTSRLLRIKKTKDPARIKLDGAKAYQELAPDLFGKKNTSDDFLFVLLGLVETASSNSRFDRYYNNKKEGYFQNELSRRFGICGKPGDEFVIVDKEAVIGYENQQEKDSILNPLQHNYKEMLKELSESNPKIFGSNLEKKSVGNELDFLAFDKQGNILLIEYKDGSNASGIYLSPFQVGIYYDLWDQFPRPELEQTICEMVSQKRKLD